MSRLKTLARNEPASPPLRGGHSLCQGCGIPMVVRTVLDTIDDAGGRRQRHGLPRGRDDALPDHRLERALAARRVRERGRGRERRRDRLPGAAPARRAARRAVTFVASPATAARTTSACRRSPARSSAAIGSSSSATTTRRT